MNLILQAIKALFRKVESKIPRTLADLLNGGKIPGDQVEEMYYTEPDTVNWAFEEQTLAFAVTDDWPTTDQERGKSIVSDFVYADYDFLADANATVKAGTEFVVLWDGKEYRCICHEGDGMEVFILGNAHLWKDRKDDTGEPFCMFMDVYYGSQGLYIIAEDTAEAHTLAFGLNVPGEVHPMSGRYLPEHTHKVTADNLDCVVPVSKGGTGVTNKGDMLASLGFRYAKVTALLPTGYSYGMIRTNLTTYSSAEGSILAVYFPNKYSTELSSSRLDFGENNLIIYDGSGAYLNSVSAGTHLFMRTEQGFTLIV